MKLLITCLLAMSFLSCTKPQAPAPILTPIKDIACDVEKAVSGGLGSTIATSLSCAHPEIVSSELQAAFGNANMCATPIVQPSGMAVMAQAKWKTIGDIPGDALKQKGMKAMAAPMGVIGSIVCPMAVQSAVGYLSNSIPVAWGCTGPNASFQGLLSALTAGCIAVVPL